MKPILAVFAAAAALSVAGAPAHAQTFDDIMVDLGLQSKKEQHINYGERAPLVLPPSYEVLPPPEDEKALTAANPQWPNDPDAARRAREEELDRVPDQFKRKYSENAAEEIYQINRQEKRVVLGAGSEYESSAGRGNQVLSPKELRAIKKKEKVDPTVFVQEPERKRLTDPPVGYRTPSPNQPYAANIDPKTGEPKKSFFSKLNPFN
ncbi:hypothetical protein [Terrihabitans sp. B22-R8]|uniref:hypothetical protein n=1 Tax=Terrihabitans sp. B22-R8 TaxID=3425128 RepID=UPI00403CE4FB